jgi:hypothetical protein
VLNIQLNNCASCTDLLATPAINIDGVVYLTLLLLGSRLNICQELVQIHIKTFYL